MPHWKQIPFVRLLPFFVAGIALQWNVHIPIPVISWLASACLCGLFLFSLLPPGRQFTWQWLPPTAVYSLLFVTGLLVMECRQQPARMGMAFWPPGNYVLQLDGNWKEGSRSFKNTARVLHRGKSIRAWLYTPKDSQFLQIKPGSWLLAKLSPKTISPPANPGCFDFKTYSLREGITHQLYLKQDQFRLIKRGERKGLAALFNHAQVRILAILRKAIPDKKEAGLAEALLIGYKDDLDKEMESAYVQTGVVHIIAISGMHLGLIYGLLLLIFNPVKHNRYGRWVRTFCIIGALWFFSILVGGSPSVLRSAVMFSAILLGEAIGRKGYAINSLAFSAFVLLCYQPYWLGDIGFQLSFAAVLSILLFYQPVYRLCYCRWWLSDMVWKLTAVTLAAQALTFPLCVYHFHQFPTWFLAANLVAVPLSNIILLGEIGLCALWYWEDALSAGGFLITHLIRWMNQWVSFVNHWPGSVWEPLQISWSQVIFLYILIGLTLLRLDFYHKIKWMALVAILFFSERAISFYWVGKKERIIVYAIPNTRAIDIQWGPHYFSFCDSAARENTGTWSFQIRPARIKYRMTRQHSPDTTAILRINWHGKKIGFLSNHQQWSGMVDSSCLDVLIVSHSPSLSDYQQFLMNTPPKRVVLDASNSYKCLREWKGLLETLSVPVHDCRELGYWEEG